MNHEEWNTVNNLRALMRQFKVIKIVDGHYQVFGNQAPGVLLGEQLAAVEALLGRPAGQDPLESSPAAAPGERGPGPVDLGTLCGILEAERKIYRLLGKESYEDRQQLAEALVRLTFRELKEFMDLLRTLRQHCRTLSMCQVSVPKPPVE